MDHGAKSIAVSTSEWRELGTPPSGCEGERCVCVCKMQYLLIDIITSDQTIKLL